MKKRLLAWLLSFCMILSLISVCPKNVQAYSVDYDFIDNVLAEVGYGNWYDDSLSIMNSSYNAVGDFGFSANMPARYLISTFQKLNGKSVITPMTQLEFTECGYNISYARTKIKIKDGMTEEQIVKAAKAYLLELWTETPSYSSLSINLTSTGSFGYATTYGGAITNVAGNTLAFVGLNDERVSNVSLTATSTENIGDYCFANYSALKDLSVSLQSEVQTFPYAFAYGCSSLKYLTFPQGKDYVFEKYSFANCTSLIHWTGLGKGGAIYNWNNTTTPDSSYYFNDYAFAGCTNITHINIVSADMTLNQYAFGMSGLSYIGFFDYNYYDTQDTLLEAYKSYAKSLMGANSISDKAFDGVSSQRIYVAHKDIYDIMNLYQDGKYFQRELAVANIKLSYDGTDSTSGSMDDVVIRYDDDVYTIVNKFEKTGYTFVGFTSEELGTSYLIDDYNAPHNGTDWIAALCCNYGATTLFPLWEATVYPITYVLNGGTDENIDLPEYHTYGESITLLDSPTKAGYDFIGWYEDEALTVPFQGIVATDTKEHTYYAKWEAHVIRITYELDGGTNHPDNPETLPFDSVRVELQDPSKIGHDFLYWTNGENDKKVTYIMAAEGDQTIYAMWKPHVYSISYDLNGGVSTGDVPTKYTYGKICYLVVPPVKDKYVFDGWYLDKELTQRVYDIAAGTYGDVTLYAKWTEAVAILPIPTKTGYRFIGWVDKKGNKIPMTDCLRNHKGDIYSNWLDVRWTIKHKSTKTYVDTLKSCYEWYRKKEEKGDTESFSEITPNGTIRIYGVADGYVTKQDISITVAGDITSLYLERDGEVVKISKTYFKENNADNIYLKGFPITQDGEYELSISSTTETKKITFLRDSSKPILTGKETKKTVKVSTLDKKVKRTTKTVKEKGKTKIVTVKKGTKKTVTTTKYETFKIESARTLYILKGKKKSFTPSVSWKDTTVGVSTVYINGKKLSAKKTKKGTYTFKKAGTYKIEIYDYIGNHYSQTIKVSDTQKDWKLPTFNMRHNATYVVGSTLSVADKDSGIKSLTIKDWHGFTKKVKNCKYKFKSTGTYIITATDKAGNTKSIKVKIVKESKY